MHTDPPAIFSGTGILLALPFFGSYRVARSTVPAVLDSARFLILLLHRLLAQPAMPLDDHS